MKSLINQGALIYYLEQTYSTRCFDQAEGHVLAIIQFYKRQFLAGHSLVELQPPLHSMTLSLYFSYEKTSFWNIILATPGKWNPWTHPPWLQSNKPVNNTSSLTQPNKIMERLFSDCQQRWIPSNLELLASLQSEDYIYFNVDLNKNSRISTTIS